MNKTTTLATIVVLLALSLSACGTVGKLKGTEERIETSGSMPKLIKENQRSEEVGTVRRFAGFADQVHDLDVSLRSAELEAKKNLVETIGTELRVEGTRGQSGFDREAVGRFFEDSQAWLTNNIRVSGASLREVYWEKWARYAVDEVAYFYRGYAVIQITNVDYERTRMAALDGLINKAMQEKNRAAEKAARDTKERLLMDDGRVDE